MQLPAAVVLVIALIEWVMLMEIERLVIALIEWVMLMEIERLVIALIEWVMMKATAKGLTSVWLMVCDRAG